MTRHALWTLAAIAVGCAALGCSMGAATRAAVPPPPPVAVAAGQPPRVYLPHHAFKLELDGVIVGGFKSMRLDIDGQTADGPEAILKLERAAAGRQAGPSRYGHLVLRGGFVADAGLPRWLATEPDPAARKSGSVIYLDRAGAEVLRYALGGIAPNPKGSAVLLVDDETDLTTLHSLALEAETITRTVFRPARGEVK